MRIKPPMDRIDEILDSVPLVANGVDIGESREGRPIRGCRFGDGDLTVSLIAGCHADEPVGPRLLRHLTSYLAALDEQDPLLTDFSWWIVPHANPDGEQRNLSWYCDDDREYDAVRYICNRVRELPGDDMEFGFPRNQDDRQARPENRAIYDWWHSGKTTFNLHASLHGTAIGAGPWFLLERDWWPRCGGLAKACAAQVEEMNYVLHDIERRGEKGFHRLARGFTSRPDSRAMAAHFLGLGDAATSAKFRPSSMETVRTLGGDPLCLVSEMPLFITPGVGETIGPPDPILIRWREQIKDWEERLARQPDDVAVRSEIAASGMRAMPVRDQMVLQWRFITAGLGTVAAEPAK